MHCRYKYACMNVSLLFVSSMCPHAQTHSRAFSCSSPRHKGRVGPPGEHPRTEARPPLRAFEGVKFDEFLTEMAGNIY